MKVDVNYDELGEARDVIDAFMTAPIVPADPADPLGKKKGRKKWK